MPSALGDQSIQALRLLLTQQAGQEFSTEEARTIAYDLLELYRYFTNLADQCGSDCPVQPEELDQVSLPKNECS